MNEWEAVSSLNPSNGRTSWTTWGTGSTKDEALENALTSINEQYPSKKDFFHNTLVTNLRVKKHKKRSR